MTPDENGQFQFYLYAARGISNAFEPVHHEIEKLQYLTSACEEQRANGDYSGYVP